MTTYTYTGIHLQYDKVTDYLVSIATTTVSFVTVDANNSFTYDDIGVPFDGDEPIINFTSPDPYHVWVNGSEVDAGYDFSMLEISWGGSNLSYLMAIFSETTDAYEDFFFYFGGTTLPDFYNIKNFESFDSTVISAESISPGPLAEGQVIAFDSLPGVVVTENDTITGDGENNVLRGGIGRDKIRGDAGNDFLYGGGGKDKLWGGNHSDQLFGGAGADILTGNNGRDRLTGGGANDKLLGGSGADNLFGGAGNDKLFGGRQLDELKGGKGRDTLMGGKGDDVLSGGGGADVFLYSGAKNEGDETIRDFEVGVDKITIGGKVEFTDILIEGDEFVTTLSWNNTRVALSGVGVSEIGIDDFNFV